MRTRRAAVAAAVVAAAALVAAGCGTAGRPAAGAAPVVVTPAATPTAGPTATAAAPAPVVMIIRHGEKPDGSEPGRDAAGHEDDSSLTATGWTRAHHLVDLFDPAQGAPRPGLARPAAIYAAGANDDGEGKRTRETVAPLADALGVPVDTRFGKGDEEALAEQLMTRPGATLVSWQHTGIPEIVDAFPSVTPSPPSEWPDDRFDVVWTLTKAGTGWHFAQVPERVLPQDDDTVIDD